MEQQYLSLIHIYRAKYDECAKKILTYKAIIAWILKSCTKEFSQYSVNFICNNCLKDDAEISKRAVHQDQLDRDEKLNGDKRIECCLLYTSWGEQCSRKY